MPLSRFLNRWNSINNDFTDPSSSPPFERQPRFTRRRENSRITIAIAQRPAFPAGVVVGAIIEPQLGVRASQLDRARHRLAVRMLEVRPVGGEEIDRAVERAEERRAGVRLAAVMGELAGVEPDPGILAETVQGGLEDAGVRVRGEQE